MELVMRDNHLGDWDMQDLAMRFDYLGLFYVFPRWPHVAAGVIVRDYHILRVKLDGIVKDNRAVDRATIPSPPKEVVVMDGLFEFVKKNAYNLLSKGHVARPNTDKVLVSKFGTRKNHLMVRFSGRIVKNSPLSY